MGTSSVVARTGLDVPPLATSSDPARKRQPLDVLVAALSLLAGLVGTLLLLEVGPEVFGFPTLFQVAGAAWVLLTVAFTVRLRGLWRERALLAATMALGTTVSLFVPEAIGLGLLALSTTTLVPTLRSSARVVAAAASAVFGVAVVASLAPALALTFVLGATLLPMGLLLATTPAGRRRPAALAVGGVCVVVFFVAGLGAATGTLEVPALLLAPAAAGAALWFSARPRPA